MTYLPAAAAEVAAILTLLRVCRNNGDPVETGTVQKHYRCIATIYARNAARTPLASQKNLEGLLAALNTKVQDCVLHTKTAAVDAVNDQYMTTVKAAVMELTSDLGSSEEVGLELEA